jgi:SHS2 domain-containing protein
VYELIDHTGDIGLRARGPTLPELFSTAARGMFDILVDAPEVRPQLEETIVVEGEGHEVLLRAWLAELLFRFSAHGSIFAEFDVEVADRRLSARVRGERFDRSRHALRTELKAVTYHALSVRREDAGWIAEVIFDV